MSKKKTTEEFKNEVIALHGNRYILDEVEYINNKTKVKIGCRKHGSFWMAPNSLLSGQNCPQCSKEKVVKALSSSNDVFLDRFHALYGDKYNTSKVNYVKALEKVCVTCPIHGDFWMTPAHLLEGHGCPKCANISRRNKKLNTLDDFINQANKIHNNKYMYNNADYINNKTKICIICPQHGEFWQRPDDHLSGKGCPKCGCLISKAEEEIYNFFCTKVSKSEIIRHDRDILDGLEIDIYLPNYKLGIEYNGLHWHSEEFIKDKNYHLNKTVAAESKGIHLIQIFEDEWLEHRELILEKLEHFIHKSNAKVIGARKCTIHPVEKLMAEQFLNKYHIQGYVTSTIYLGAFFNDNLIGLMSFLEEKEGMWNLTRFTTNINYSIPGLANKIFKYFVSNYNPLEVKTFLDRRWSHTGINVYDKMNFKLDKITGPEYRYVNGNKRMHKFSFRKQKLNKKYGLPLSMTEYEMTKQLGFYRIWDCGLYRYVWKNENF